MCSISVLCPLCSMSSFSSIDALRNSLIKAANGPLACPICSELFLGLDKLTIHLFSHTNLMTHTTKVIDLKKNSCEIEATATTTITENATNSSLDTRNAAGIIADISEKSILEEKSNLEMKTKKSKQLNIKEGFQKDAIATSSIKTKEYQPILNSISDENLQLRNSSNLSACEVCEFTFRNDQLRDMHFRLVHQNSPQPIVVSTEEFPLTVSNTPTIPATFEPGFKCHLCSKTFKMTGSLRVHLKVVHMVGINQRTNSPKLGICDRIRSKEIKSYQNPKPSNTKMLSSNMQQTIVASTPINVQQTIVATKALKCSTNLNDLQLEQLPTHQVTQNGNTENTLILPRKPSVFKEPITSIKPSILESKSLVTLTPKDGEVNNESVNKPIVDNPKIWECDVCSKSFTTKYFLKKHKRLHTGEMPYSCEICGRTFTFQQSYHKHLLYHSNEKPHICAVCGRAFKELSTLHNHERIHSGEKPFKCEICGKCFRQRVSFLVHTRIHTGVMPYKCEFCEKNFRYKVSLRTHKCTPQTTETTDSNIPQLTSTNNIPENTSDHLTENFIKAFLESTNGNSVIQNESQNSPGSMEISAITSTGCLEPIDKGDSVSVEALLSKTIDDIVVESCNKMGIGNNENKFPINLATPHESPSTISTNGFGIQNFSDGSSSPLQKLQNMRLQSPKFDIETQSSNDHCVKFSQFLFDNNVP